MPSKKIDCWFIHQGKIIKGYFDDRWFNSNVPFNTKLKGTKQTLN